MSSYAFRHALRYQAESWHGGRGRAHEVCGHIFEATHLGSKVIQRSICLRNALWPPNLVERIPDQSVMHCWGQSHKGVSWGQVGVNLLNSALWPPNLVGRTPDQSVMHLLGSKVMLGSARVNQRSNCIEMLYALQIW